MTSRVPRSLVALWLGWLWLALTALAADPEAPSTTAESPAATPESPAPARRFIVRTWTTDNELPHRTVTSIIQSRDGYLWLGTRYGLARFDGLRCDSLEERNAPGLGGLGVAMVFEDSRGELWIGTESGRVLLIQDGQAKPVETGEDEAEPGGFAHRIVSACEDATGTVWLSAANGQLWRCRGAQARRFTLNAARYSLSHSVIAESGTNIWLTVANGQAAVPLAGDVTNLVANPQMAGSVNFLLASRQGGYWRCLTDGHIQKCQGQTIERDWGGYPWSSRPGTITAACEDLQGNLILGTRNDGVYWFDAEGRASQISPAQNLPRGTILALCMDREGNLWVGSDGGGLSRVKENQFETIDESRGLARSAVQSVAADAAGSLWIGLNENGGISRWLDGVKEAYGSESGVQNVWSVLVDRSQRLWIGSLGYGVEIMSNRRPRMLNGPRWIFALFEDRQQRLWAGAQEGLALVDDQGCRLISPTNGVAPREVRALAEDAAGGIWIGTAGGGLSRYFHDAIQTWHMADGLPSDTIFSLYCDTDNALWIGTKANGLARFKDNQWTRYTTREGLACDRITYMIEDTVGYLWLGSPLGIMRVAKKELNELAAGARHQVACRSYTMLDGLPTRECTMESQPGACLDSQGKLWFATAKGLVGVDPKTLRTNAWKPPVVIEDVLVDGVSKNTAPLRGGLAGTVLVPPGRQRVEIQYTALNLSAAEECRFQYLMEGHETVWNDAGNSRVAIYPKLPPGSYTFRVKACNEDGLWNDEGRSLEIIVQPPFWRTWWFITLLTAGLLGGGAGIVHYFSTQKLQRQLERMRQQEALEKERQRIAQDIHDQLGANLTSVTMLSELLESEKDDPEEVEICARQIAQNTRDTTRVLDEIVWAVNPVNDTLDSLMSYACKNTQEFLALAGLQYRLEMPDQLPKLNLPPEFRHNVFLALKEAITNVVRHSGATAVQVRVRLLPGRLEVEVEDNGRGLGGLDEARLRARNGVRGMQKRLSAIGGQAELVPAPEKGALVRLIAPLAGL